MFVKHLVCALIATFSCAAVFAGPININSADAQSIAKELSGVGQAKAEAIVAYRTANGKFQSIAELSQVKGIGVRILELNRDNILLESADQAKK